MFTNSVDSGFPLAAFLKLYNAARYECYIEYMRGAKALLHWLGPLEFPTLPENFKVPTLLQGYESQELAKAVYETNFQTEEFETPNTEILSIIEDTITYITIKELML